MEKKMQGFATFTEEKKREIAIMGGKAAHAKGKAHKWDRESAREASRKGVQARKRKKEIAS